MKKITIILSALIYMTTEANAQIPNSGFESLSGWVTGNATLSSDHYPTSVGNYSIKLENQLPVVNNQSYGYAVTGSVNNGCVPSFPITGHPNQLYGYYKCFPLNNDTIQIGIMLFNNGVWVAGGELTTTNTVSNWSSFNIPISSYTNADSATITVAAFYNDTTCGMPYGPFGNSILYVDNISFDSLITITSVAESTLKKASFNLYPNPASDYVTLNTDITFDEDLTLNFYDVLGTLVKSELLKQNTQQVDIKDLNNGFYTLVINSKKLREEKSLLISR